eukprot:s3664_g1.t1
MPLGPIEDDNKLHDKEAEAVIQYAEAESRAQEEQRAMSAEDPLLSVLQESRQPADDSAVTVFDDAVSGSAMPNVPMSVEAPAGSASSTGQTGAPELDDPGLAVPVTPPRHFIQVDDESPRAAASARPSSFEVWSDHPIDQTPPVPDSWIGDLADQVEIERLCAMRVLVRASEFKAEPTGKLTTKFVRDWRLKMFGEGASQQKLWMRRSRLVAREFATSKRLDTFSPATGAHVSNILLDEALKTCSKRVRYKQAPGHILTGDRGACVKHSPFQIPADEE